MLHILTFTIKAITTNEAFRQVTVTSRPLISTTHFLHSLCFHQQRTSAYVVLLGTSFIIHKTIAKFQSIRYERRNKMFSVVTIFLLAIVPLRMANTSEVRSSYGQPCNETTPCKASPHLVCSHETKTCSCFLPDDMQFDSNYDRCVRLVRTEGCR